MEQDQSRLDRIYEQFWSVIQMCERRCGGCENVQHKPGEDGCTLEKPYADAYRRIAKMLDEALEAAKPAWQRAGSKTPNWVKKRLAEREAERAKKDAARRAEEDRVRRVKEQAEQMARWREKQAKILREAEARRLAELRKALPPPVPEGYKRVYNRKTKTYDLHKLCPCCGGAGWVNPENEAPAPPPEKGRLINLDFDDE